MSIALAVVGWIAGEHLSGITWLLGVSAAFVVAFWGTALIASLRLHRLWSHLDAYVSKHGGRIQYLTHSFQPSEILSARGEGGLSRTVLTLPNGIRVGDWEYVREWDGRSTRSAYTWGYVAIPLATPVPHIVLDSRRNQRVTAVGAGASLTRSQTLSLEGDFDRYFTVFCPDGYGADALYFLSPDVMADLIDTAPDWDVEFVDRHVVFFRPGPILRASDSDIGELISLATSWEQSARKWAHWRDDRLETPSVAADSPARHRPRAGVHESGLRLDDTRLVMFGLVGFTIMIVALYAYGVVDMILN
jgi:hypothetical protein